MPNDNAGERAHAGNEDDEFLVAPYDVCDVKDRIEANEKIFDAVAFTRETFAQEGLTRLPGRTTAASCFRQKSEAMPARYCSRLSARHSGVFHKPA